MAQRRPYPITLDERRLVTQLSPLTLNAFLSGRTGELVSKDERTGDNASCDRRTARSST